MGCPSIRHAGTGASGTRAIELGVSVFSPQESPRSCGPISRQVPRTTAGSAQPTRGRLNYPAPAFEMSPPRPAHPASPDALRLAERTIAWLSRSRRSSKGYDHRTDSSKCMVRISSINVRGNQSRNERHYLSADWTGSRSNSGQFFSIHFTASLTVRNLRDTRLFAVEGGLSSLFCGWSAIGSSNSTEVPS